ncbi:AfsR/SARP family transcriptional regulator [Sphaerisporangium dianthi]|uniref:BTAD domain-containing putative transcriptional regulator n=1 Tax=Sphaerisporangium dianthi TaxID=1436120 RepID=A0ABV9CR09_9ACTN
MEIRVLGPVDLWRDERSIAVVGQKQRTLLALLVLRAGQVVSHDRLLSTLWGTRIPATGRRLLHNHLWSLRRLLADGDALGSTPTGYTLRLPPGATDLDVFRAQTAAARAALSAGDSDEAAARLRAALSLWRGAALGGTAPELQETEGPALEELRVAALVDRIELDLSQRRHSELVGELRSLIRENPSNERLRGQLMRALHHEGRTAEALEEFQAGRRYLREELGLDPGEGLVGVHRMILAGEAPSSPAAAPPPPVTPATPVPHQLPPAVTRFTGRAEPLRELDRVLLSDGTATAVVVSAIAGTAGVGKTALAVHWGYRTAERFPDGQLYINLHGYSPGRMTPVPQALNRLLRGLGVDEEHIPHDLDERAALYRSLLAGRRMLIVLDNAAAAEQIRPLLPGSSASRVVITSRDALRSLSVTHDVHNIALDVLTADEAITLLKSLLADGGEVDDTDTIAELAGLCGYLPLALRLAGAQLAGGPAAQVADFVGKLRRENRLTVLDLAEDPAVGVRSALELSYRTLADPVQRVFRLFSVHPGPSVGLDAASALVGMQVESTAQAVAILVGAHLLQENEERRLSMHDLVRVYAEEKCIADETVHGRDDALTRVLDWYRYAALKAMYRMAPSDVTYLDISPVAGTPAFSGFDEAMAWLDREHPVLVRMIAHAAGEGRHVHAWQIFSRISWFLYARNHLEDLLMTGETALSSARLAGHRHGEAEILSDLGYAQLFLGRYAEHLEYQRAALEIRRASHDRVGEAKALRHLAYALYLAGRPAEAIDVGEQGLALCRELGERSEEYSVLDVLAFCFTTVGRFEEASEILQESLIFWREVGRHYDQAYAFVRLGQVRTELDEFEGAMDCFQQALLMGRKQGNQRLEVDALNAMAIVLRRQERYDGALDAHEEALRLTRSMRSRPLEGEALNSFAGTLLAIGDAETALRHYRNALRCIGEESDVYQWALAHEGLGDALHALGSAEEAAEKWRTALAIWESAGAHQAGGLVARMRDLGLS